MTEIHPNHVEFLHDTLSDPIYQNHLGIFDFSDKEEVKKKLYKITEKQYRYVLFLLYNSKWFKLKALLDQFGILHVKTKK